MKIIIALFTTFLLAGCFPKASIPQPYVATDNPDAYLGENIAFAVNSNWQTYKPLLSVTKNLTRDITSREEQLRGIAFYVSNLKNYSAGDVRNQAESSVIDIFNKKQGVCYDGAVLFVAMSRLLGIPARVVFPLFENHAFAQAFVGGRWVNIDATFGTVNYNFHTSQPLYLYSRFEKNNSMLVRKFIPGHGFNLLTVPLTSKLMGGDMVLVSVNRVTKGKAYRCEGLECRFENTSDLLQPIMEGFEVLKPIKHPELSVAREGSLTAVLPKGEYMISYVKETNSQCIAQTEVNLTTNSLLTKLTKCKAVSNAEFRSLKHWLRI